MHAFAARGRRIASLALVFFCLAGAWAAPTVWAGLVEAAIWKKVERLLQQGRELEACQEALKLKEFKSSPVYKEAEKGMMRYGLSLDEPLSSYTGKRMVDLQNEAQAEAAASGQLPKAGVRERHRDAWGNAMRVELVTKHDFVYAIRSAGPDRRFFSDDDLIVGVRDERALDPAPANPWDTARDIGRGSMIKGRSSAGGGDGPAPNAASSQGKGAPSLPPAAQGPEKEGREVEVTLDELLKSK